MSEAAGTVLAVLLVLVALGNVYFLWIGSRLHLSVSPRSPLLFALFGVQATVWVVGVYIAIVAARTLFDLPPLPFSGFGLGLAILALELLPAFIWWQMRRFVIGDQDRDHVRDAARDEGRDLVRDSARDIARDAEHDREP